MGAVADAEKTKAVSGEGVAGPDSGACGNPVLEAIRARRSVRSYAPVQVDERALSLILEAGRCAPSGGNSRTTRFLVIQKPEVLRELRALAEREFARMEVSEDRYPSVNHSIRMAQKGGYDFFYGAPTLVSVSNLRGYGNAMADCAVALENMMLAAVSLRVGSCWINQLRWLAENPAVKEFMGGLGMPENEVICGGLALGYPGGEDRRPPDLAAGRKGNPVVFIR
jgi:nitroreductase